MIIDHKKIAFEGKIIFESIVSNSLQRLSYLAHNETCFVHLKKGANITYSSSQKTEVEQGNFTLTSSGNLIIKTVPNEDDGLFQATIIHFPKEFIHSIFHNQLPDILNHPESQKNMEILTAQPCVILGNYINSIQLYLENPQRINKDLLHVKIKEILLLLLQSKKGNEVASLLKTLFADRTVTFKATVESHLYNDISLEEMAYLSNMSLSTFKRRFKEVFNTTPAQYITDKRLLKARSLLELPDLSMNDITDQTGFKTSSHLSRKFKEKFGLSPRAYRLNQIDKNMAFSDN